jgi:hypothetical protein
MKRLIVLAAGMLLLIGGRASGALYTVTAGTIVLGSAEQNAVFTLGGADIQNGKIIFDYSGASSPIATILDLLADSYNAGHWNVGQFRNSTAQSTGLSLGCSDDGAGKATVMSTYPGDYNLDGVVNHLDLNVFMTNAGKGTTWQTGDANYDGVVNGLDLDLLIANAGLPQLRSDPVPEPAAVILWSLLASLAVALVRPRRNFCRSI